MLDKLFGIKNDGVEIHKERIEKWSYIAWPPKSKYLLWKNIELFLLLIMLMIACNIIVIMFDKDLSIPFFGFDFCLLVMLFGAGWGMFQEWKTGKYWNGSDE